MPTSATGQTFQDKARCTNSAQSPLLSTKLMCAGYNGVAPPECVVFSLSVPASGSRSEPQFTK